MKIKWTAHLPAERQAPFAQQIKSSLDVLERLSSILKESLEVADKSTTSDYDKASWPYYAADRNGYKKALREVLELLDIKSN